jgi:hypothetical protein
MDRMSRTRSARTTRTPLAALALGAVLAGCSFTSESSIAIFADPGKYQYHNCDQLIAAATGVDRRQQELKLLIEAAERSAAGGVMGTLAYRGEYRSNGEELAIIERTARTKKCLTAANWRSSTAIR